jgi:hypothetical protein
VPNSSIARGKHSVLAGKLLERLPLFHEATIDEILDIRKELEQPLIRFRSGVIGFSREMQHAGWDKGFPAEADLVFYERVAPAVLEIEEAIKTSKSLLALSNRLLNKPLASGGVLSVLLSQITELPMLASVALLGGAAAAAATVGSTYYDIVQDRKTAEQNQLYFYYRAGQHLQGK